jgi:hypothetical protein
MTTLANTSTRKELMIIYKKIKHSDTHNGAHRKK